MTVSMEEFGTVWAGQAFDVDLILRFFALFDAVQQFIAFCQLCIQPI